MEFRDNPFQIALKKLNPLKIVIFGGNQEIHQMVNVFANLLFNDYETYKLKPFVFYLIPTKKNLVAEFLANYDIWYNRYLYTPFLKTPLVPSARAEDINGEEVES